MNNKSSEVLSQFLELVRDVIKTTQSTKEDLDVVEKETIDLLHEIELGSYKTRSKYATQLANVRKRRRKLKDYLCVNEQLNEYFTSKEFTQVYKKLETLLGTVRKQENYVKQHREYTARVCNNLTITKGENQK